jgi:outer membrane immunogenic protein
MKRVSSKLGRFALSTVCVVAFSASTYAGDALNLAAPGATQWAGFYLGGDIGGAWGSASMRGVVPAASDMNASARALEAAIDNGGVSESDFIAGAHIGYNVQRGSLVYGLELSFDQLNHENTRDTGLVTVGGQTGRTVDRAVDNRLFTVRARVGYAMDRSLFYVTGGYAEIDRSFSHRQSWSFGDGCPAVGDGQQLCHSGSASDMYSTYTVGGGVEFALTNRLSVRAEYLYVPGSDFSFVSQNAGFAGQPVSHSASIDHIDIARFGLTLRDFMGSDAPLK